MSEDKAMSPGLCQLLFLTVVLVTGHGITATGLKSKYSVESYSISELQLQSLYTCMSFI